MSNIGGVTPSDKFAKFILAYEGLINLSIADSRISPPSFQLVKPLAGEGTGSSGHDRYQQELNYQRDSSQRHSSRDDYRFVAS